MADDLMLEIVTPEKMAFSGKIEEVTILERKVSLVFCVVMSLF